MADSRHKYTPERWARLQSLFLAAVGREAEERDAYLAEHCGDDASLRVIAARKPALT